MKRSADQLKYENVEINFKNAFTGDIYELTDDVSMKHWPSTMMNSFLIEKFSKLTGICIYQVKLMYNDTVVDKNKTLKGQFDITESVMIFKVIKECNQIINIKDLKWELDYPEEIWNDGYDGQLDEVWYILLPKVKKFNIEFINKRHINEKIIFSDVARVRLYNELKFYYNDENKAPYTLFYFDRYDLNDPQECVRWLVLHDFMLTINIEEF